MSGTILDGSGRFILLDKPVAFPFKDMVTGTPEGPVFDLSVDFEMYDGVGYIKAEHVIEMAHTLGMSTKEETLEMRARISELERENASLPDNVERLIHGIDNLVTEFRSGTSSDNADLAYSSLPVNSEAFDPDNRQGEGEKPDSLAESIGITDAAKADGIDKPALKVGKPSINKGPAKFSAGPDDGFGFSE